MLTNHAPFEGNDVGAVLQKVQRGDFPPPRKLDAMIDRPLEAICLKAMALKPENRYATPRALTDDIEHWLADEPVTAYRDPLLARISRAARRHRVAAAAVSALLLAAVVGLALGTVLLRASRREPTRRGERRNTTFGRPNWLGNRRNANLSYRTSTAALTNWSLAPSGRAMRFSAGHIAR